MKNFFEGFGNWLSTKVGVDAKYAADQDLILSNVSLQDDEGKPIQFPGVSHWKIIKSDPNQRWAKIKNVDFSDPDNRKLGDFPQGFAPNNYAGREFLIRGKEFDKLLAPRTPPGGAAPAPAGMGGGMGALGGLGG